MIPAPRGSGVAFVTGAGGFLGGHVASAFERAGWTVAGFDVRDGEKWRTGPVDAAVLAQAAGILGAPEIIFHAAGFGSVGASLADPAGDFDAGPGSLRQTLDFMRTQAPDARLIFPSSAAVYGGGQAGPIPEGAPVRPISPYGLHKALAEQLIAGWADIFGLDVVAIRFFSLYGPDLHKQLLWDIARRIAQGAEVLELAGDGEETRDFLHVQDAVNLIGCLGAAPLGPTPRVLNGGAGQALTVRSAVTAVAAALGFRGEIQFNGEVRAGDPRSLVADVSLASGLGFEPLTRFDDGIREFALWAERRLRSRVAQ